MTDRQGRGEGVARCVRATPRVPSSNAATVKNGAAIPPTCTAVMA